eukprot:NODE_29_length_37665_cov_1.081563.p17 type:complete len:231 gc:universal NODE_29_length_37665_cov_1.081563:35130-34438(-)
MVFYFQLEKDMVYMGRDKFENEILIQHCCEYDIWFHVDHLSSAHVYLRSEEFKLKITEILQNHFAQYKNFKTLPFKEMEKVFKSITIPEQVLLDCGQIVKGNSIKGSKEDAVDIIYTPCWNLKKTRGMDTGTVSFMKDNLVKRVRIERDGQLLKKLTKTKVEKNEEDFKKTKVEYHTSISNSYKEYKESIKNQKDASLKKKVEKEMAYVDMFDENAAISNKDGFIEDDFM